MLLLLRVKVLGLMTNRCNKPVSIGTHELRAGVHEPASAHSDA